MKRTIDNGHRGFKKQYTKPLEYKENKKQTKRENTNNEKLVAAIVIASGEGVEKYPLTTTVPESLLKITNTSILSMLLDDVAEIAEEIVLIVGHKKEVIRERFGKYYRGTPIRYVEQKDESDQKMTALNASFRCLEEKVHTFLILNGRDIYAKDDIETLVQYDHALLTDKEHSSSWKRYVSEIRDGDTQPYHISPKEDFMGETIGAYAVSTTILSACKNATEHCTGISTLIASHARSSYVRIIEAVDWQPIRHAWDLLSANEKKIKRITSKNEGYVEAGAVLRGEVVLGKGSVIRSGAYIEGPVVIGRRCVIGPNCFIRAGTTLGDEVKIGNACEIKNSILGDHTKMSHLSYCGDSIIGSHCNMGAGTIVANVRHDGATIKLRLWGKIFDSGRKKLGTVMGDGVKTGIHTSIYPGRILEARTRTMPGECVRKNKIGES